MLNPEEHTRVEQTKRRLKSAAAACHARLTHLTRIKIAWAIRHFPEECIGLAKSTLRKKWRRGDPLHKQWEKLLEKEPKFITNVLLSETQSRQELNSCHPFGHALAIYENYHASRRHQRN